MTLCRRVRCFALLAVAVATNALAAAPELDLKRIQPVAEDQPIPIQDFVRAPSWRDPKLNPSGSYLAARIVNEKNRYQLTVYELKTQKSAIIEGGDNREISEFHWLTDQRLVFTLSSDEHYGLALCAVDIDGRNVPYPLVQYYGASLVATPVNDRTHPLVWMRYDGIDGSDLDRGVASIKTGITGGRFADLWVAAERNAQAVDGVRQSNELHIAETFPQPGRGIAYRYMEDRDGHLAFAFTSDAGVNVLHRLTPQRTWETCPFDLELTGIVRAGDEPGQVIAAVADAPNTPRALHVADAATGKVGELLVEDPNYDFDGWLYQEPASRKIVGGYFNRDRPQMIWWDAGFQAVQKTMDGLFPGRIVQIIGNSEKAPLFLVRTFSDRQPSAYHWVDLEKHTAGLLRNSEPWIDPQRMRAVQVMKFKTRDGHVLDAYVTLPKGSSKKKPAPLVVLPHDGPHARSNWEYDREAQFFASRGYAVLQPNYRGSPGYDWKFPIEDRWAFEKMRDDVTEATHALIATGAVDRARIAIVGHGFGGYLAMEGVVHERSLYRCAVSISGIFDWAALLRDLKYYQFSVASYGQMRRRLGDPAKQGDKYAAMSPLRQIAPGCVPVLVVHRTDDSAGEKSQSRQLLAELEKNNVPHDEFVLPEREDSTQQLNTKVAMYGRIEAFLSQHLAPTSAAEAPSPHP